MCKPLTAWNDTISLENVSTVTRFSFKKYYFLASSTVNDMFTHFEQLRYLDFYTPTKLHFYHFTARGV
jgi:hypothetical protein